MMQPSRERARNGERDRDRGRPVFLGFWGAEPPSLSGWSLFITPQGSSRDFGITVVSGLVGGPLRSLFSIMCLFVGVRQCYYSYSLRAAA